MRRSTQCDAEFCKHDCLQDTHLRQGYQLLYTPHIAKAELWKTSGHLDFYAESMFDRMKVSLREMLCTGVMCLPDSWHATLGGVFER